MELQYAAAPLIIHRGSYDQKVIFKTQYTILNGDCSNVLDGISVYFVPGHTPGSQAVAVDTKGGKYLLSGDLIGLYECYESNPMICSGGHLDLSVYYDSLNKSKSRQPVCQATIRLSSGTAASYARLMRGAASAGCGAAPRKNQRSCLGFPESNILIEPAP